MSGLRAAISTSKSLSALFSLTLQSPLLLPTVSRSATHRRSLSGTGSGSSFSSSDDLEGLIGPDAAFRSDEVYMSRENNVGAVVTAKDLSFLHEAVGCHLSLGGEINPGDAQLIMEGLKNPNYDSGDEMEKFLRQFRARLDETLVVEVLKLAKDPTLGVRFFIWAGRQIGYCHSGRTYEALLQVLQFDKNSKVPQYLLKEIGADDRLVLGKLLNILVRKCCQNGCWNEALEELGRLKDLGCVTSRATFNALMQVFLDADKVDSAYLVYREMMDAGHSIDRFTMGCFVYSICKSGNWEEALNVMEEADFTPDTVVYNKMIGGLMEASLFEEAMSFLHRMRSNSFLPNFVTYKTLLTGFLKKKQLGWCKRIVNMMITEGCYPNPALFNSLVHAYCTTRDYIYAFKMLKKMEGCGLRPGYVTYNILIGGICGNEDLPSSSALQLAERAYVEMLDAGCVLNKVNVGSFVRSLCGAGKFDKAFVVIKELMTKGFIPDASTYSKVFSNKLGTGSMKCQEMAVSPMW